MDPIRKQLIKRRIARANAFAANNLPLFQLVIAIVGGAAFIATAITAWGAIESAAYARDQLRLAKQTYVALSCSSSVDFTSAKIDVPADRLVETNSAMTQLNMIPGSQIYDNTGHDLAWSPHYVGVCKLRNNSSVPIGQVSIPVDSRSPGVFGHQIHQASINVIALGPGDTYSFAIINQTLQNEVIAPTVPRRKIFATVVGGKTAAEIPSGGPSVYYSVPPDDVVAEHPLHVGAFGSEVFAPGACTGWRGALPNGKPQFICTGYKGEGVPVEQARRP